MPISPVLIAGRWRQSAAAGSFRSENPRTREPLPEEFPVSSWQDCEAALDAAEQAAAELRNLPSERLGEFLECFAARIESRASDLVEAAHAETALPKSPRLADVELPRTTGQLRQAAAAAREGSWRMATIDAKNNIRSCYAAIGPVCVFGPNNFPFAFNSAAGGDFAAAIAAGNPVIAKANSSHPLTTRLLAEAAHAAVEASRLPAGTVQMVYRLGHADGERLVADPRVGATAYTGSREAGLKLKSAADRAGKPIYLELSSINPVVILPGALAERGEKIAEEFSTSCLMGTGQFCTNPGLVVLLRGKEANGFVDKVKVRFEQAPNGTLLSAGVAKSLRTNLARLESAGARPLTGGAEQPGNGAGHCHANTLLSVSAADVLADAEAFQTEAFGNASLFVIADDGDQAEQVLAALDGNLTGCVYSAMDGSDDAMYDQLAPALRLRVGRLLNDKMPTGVAVSPAMNHGGPYPATGHPGFTAVGIPASLRRFATLECYDNVRPHRLPPALGDKNPNGTMWRLIDGRWTTDDIGA
jgi:NADP-dependent aldehyde dehydrogenase